MNQQNLLYTFDGDGDNFWFLQSILVLISEPSSDVSSGFEEAFRFQFQKSNIWNQKEPAFIETDPPKKPWNTRVIVSLAAPWQRGALMRVQSILDTVRTYKEKQNRAQ